jgi:DNA-binding transcriptional LysR family regulator
MRLNDSHANMVDESIDVAIRIANVNQQPALIARKLATHTRSICASASYLERHGTPQKPADLGTHNCLQFSYGTKRHTWFLRADQHVEEIEVNGFISVNNSEVLRRAAIDGIGIVLLPDWLIQQDIDAGRLIRVLDRYEANPGKMNVDIYAVYPANRRGSSKIKAFADMLETALAAIKPAR